MHSAAEVKKIKCLARNRHREPHYRFDRPKQERPCGWAESCSTGALVRWLGAVSKCTEKVAPRSRDWRLIRRAPEALTQVHDLCRGDDMNVISWLICAAAFLLAPASHGAEAIGHVDFNELLTTMREYKEVKSKLDALIGERDRALKKMNDEFEQRRKQYQANESSLSDYEKFLQLQELRALQARADEYAEKAEGAYQLRQRELLKPLAERAKKAIDEVAKERGLSYVLDTTDTTILFFSGGNDISKLVQQKLGGR